MTWFAYSILTNSSNMVTTDAPNMCRSCFTLLKWCCCHNIFADGCPAKTDQIAQGIGIHLHWNESEISSHLSQPCPCKDIIVAPEIATISRRCGGTYSEGASWDEVDYSQCHFTSITLRLCEASLVSGCHDWSTENVKLRPQQVKCLFDLSLVPRPLVKIFASGLGTRLA